MRVGIPSPTPGVYLSDKSVSIIWEIEWVLWISHQVKLPLRAHSNSSLPSCAILSRAYVPPFSFSSFFFFFLDNCMFDNRGTQLYMWGCHPSWDKVQRTCPLPKCPFVERKSPRCLPWELPLLVPATKEQKPKPKQSPKAWAAHVSGYQIWQKVERLHSWNSSYFPAIWFGLLHCKVSKLKDKSDNMLIFQ